MTEVINKAGITEVPSRAGIWDGVWGEIACDPWEIHPLSNLPFHTLLEAKEIIEKELKELYT